MFAGRVSSERVSAERVSDRRVSDRRVCAERVSGASFEMAGASSGALSIVRPTFNSTVRNAANSLPPGNVLVEAATTAALATTQSVSMRILFGIVFRTTRLVSFRGLVLLSVEIE